MSDPLALGFFNIIFKRINILYKDKILRLDNTITAKFIQLV
jgi:hypothetical protein